MVRSFYSHNIGTEVWAEKQTQGFDHIWFLWFSSWQTQLGELFIRAQHDQLRTKHNPAKEQQEGLRWFNEYHKENVQLSNKQILFNTFDDSLPMQMPISTQRKLRLLVLLQKKYLYTCKNIVTKPNLEEFLRKLFEQYRIENCGKQY